jgi:DNA-directed RNA polymerase specialized sigma24 family protein
VIQDTFLRELDDAQIARRLGKSKQAVYNLRHRALARLQKILTQNIPQEKGRKMH